ncbi:hypothetical protein ROZALSC1DRAFT_20173 [Rozella allomycis CSF55]|uniref:DDB1- and CUL4-associated factor 12 beta-propeller domain-containing protein n=1 Tax=Rozella allomycis (strain CSF55) TaxID=988480 RepID=A0A4P9YPZ3_ROZAC|nr:hypothetical protein ROZALSC1DRAFT_20173 [Rozella allomycis CSF55]
MQVVLYNNKVKKSFKIPIPGCEKNRLQERRGNYILEINPTQDVIITCGYTSNCLSVLSFPMFSHIQTIPVKIISPINKAHEDVIFDGVWLTSDTFISASRDSNIGIWKANQDQFTKHGLKKAHEGPTRRLCAIGQASKIRFPWLRSNLKNLGWYNIQTSKSISYRKPIHKINVNATETCCVARLHNSLVIGSKQGLHITDVRQRNIVDSIIMVQTSRSCYGVRSLLVKDDYILIGKGGPEISVFDIRKNCILENKFFDVDRDGYDCQAIFSMSLNPSKNILSVCGGPIDSSSLGSHASLWY